MKGQEIINHIVRAKMPDREQVRENCHRQAAVIGTVKKRNAWIRGAIPASVCAAVLLLCVWTIPGLFNTPTPNIPNNPGVISSGNQQGGEQAGIATNPSTDINTTIPGLPDDDFRRMTLVGLPVDNFSLADIDSGVAADRMAYSQFSDFFSYHAPQLFAFVRVANTEQWEDKSRPVYGEGGVLRQNSTLHIISALWSDGDVPKTITLSQSLYGGCMGDEKTNLLREGGVYLLPLSYSQPDDTWYVMGDLDVLFEVDDNVRVWTHSRYEDFSRFDGQDASVLADIISAMAVDENLPAAITTFGQIVRYWGVLTEATVLSVARTADQWGYDQIAYRLKVDNILSVSSSKWYAWDAESGDEITVVSYGSTAHLEQGDHYLIILDPSEGGPYVEEQRVARINADDTITAIHSEAINVFAEFNGYTVEQIVAEAERAKAWHESYAK